MRVVDDDIWLNIAVLFNPDPFDLGVSLHKESGTMSLAERPTPRTVFRREEGGYTNLSNSFFFPIHWKVLESVSLHAPLEKGECHVLGEEDSPDVCWYGGKCISHAADDKILEQGGVFEMRRFVRRVAPEVAIPHKLKW
jgi:hypothetical protein